MESAREPPLRARRELPAVLQHNDLGTWNTVWAAPGEFTVLDWESARADGLPLWDLLYFAVDALGLLDGARTAEQRAEHAIRLLRGELPASDTLFDTIRRYVARLAIPAEAVGPLATLCWLHHGLSHVRRGETAGRRSPGPAGGANRPHLARRSAARPRLGPLARLGHPLVQLGDRAPLPGPGVYRRSKTRRASAPRSLRSASSRRMDTAAPAIRSGSGSTTRALGSMPSAPLAVVTTGRPDAIASSTLTFIPLPRSSGKSRTERPRRNSPAERHLAERFDSLRPRDERVGATAGDAQPRVRSEPAHARPDIADEPANRGGGRRPGSASDQPGDGWAVERRGRIALRLERERREDDPRRAAARGTGARPRRPGELASRKR